MVSPSRLEANKPLLQLKNIANIEVAIAALEARLLQKESNPIERHV